MISLIVARADTGVIGSNNDLPWQLSDDLKRFKELTTGKTVVMGRKTFESIVNRLGHPLPNRTNVVVTRQVGAVYEGASVLNDIGDIDSLASLDEVFIIGGAELYGATLSKANRLYTTEVHADIRGDTYFPEFNSSEWIEISRETHTKDDRNQYDFDFVVYERI